MSRHLNFINGSWVPAASGSFYSTQNPARPSELVGEFPRSDVADVTAAVAAAEGARAAWASTPGPQRGALLLRFAQLLDDSKQELGRIVALEMGKALGEAVGEVGRAAAEARYMAGEASQPIGDVYPSERAGFTCQTIREPLGVIASITPWNFPVVAPVRKIAPALAYGNTVVCKPASQTPWCAVFILQLLEKAGLPPGVVNLVIGPGSSVGDALVNDRRVRGISFTGSSDIGTRLYEAAARRLASVQLELGGKNPALVIDYDDLDGAAREISAAAFLCSGQRCTALSRVVVLESQADALVARLTEHIGRIKVGDGLADGTTMGPLASLGQFRNVERYVREGIASGATLVAGGKALTENPERDGYYYGATLFDRVARDSSLAKEEIFGPVLPIIRVRDVDEAISVANDTRYGLAVSIFSNRANVWQQCAQRIDAGMIHLNHGTASQAHVPFGGRKDSGQGAYSIGPTSREFFTVVKAVYTKW
jgi:acyl-CoA reductase-like NAD-dependent aldehyde dehydrogenase